MNFEQAAPDRPRPSLGAAAIYRLRANRADERAEIERRQIARALSDGMDDGDADPMPRDGSCEWAWLDLGGGG